jgi:hypothetical protein
MVVAATHFRLFERLYGSNSTCGASMYTDTKHNSIVSSSISSRTLVSGRRCYTQCDSCMQGFRARVKCTGTIHTNSTHAWRHSRLVFVPVVNASSDAVTLCNANLITHALTHNVECSHKPAVAKASAVIAATAAMLLVLL